MDEWFWSPWCVVNLENGNQRIVMGILRVSVHKETQSQVRREVSLELFKQTMYPQLYYRWDMTAICYVYAFRISQKVDLASVNVLNRWFFWSRFIPDNRNVVDS